MSISFEGGGGNVYNIYVYIYIYIYATPPPPKTQVLNLDNCQNHWKNATFEKQVYFRLCETHILQVQAVKFGKFN